jgi:DNA uptake protein ComE-like DNA-binding protein
MAVLLAACGGSAPEPSERRGEPTTAATPDAVAMPTVGPTPPAVAEGGRGLVARSAVVEVAAEAPRAGYDRELFDHWIDADGDCRDTRDEVLAAESHAPVSGCDITTGEWGSYYDGQMWTRSRDVDVDHLVPLAEAWDSGAHRWTADTRRRFANDLDDERALVAVTDNVNQAKGDQDPAEWLPEQRVCRYIGEWVAVKTRWSLVVDPAEQRALRETAQGCDDRPIDVQSAAVDTAPAPATPGETDVGCVDVNRAGRAQLQRITQIGPERADEFIAHRPYDSLDQLQRIDGIGSARVDQIRDQGLAAVDC